LKGALILPIVGCQVNLPCIVVRKQQKNYGIIGRTIGAPVSKSVRILFFDDVISEGLPTIEGAKPLEEFGAKVSHMMVVVDREQGGREKLEKLGYKIEALAKISDLVNNLFKNSKIAENQANAVLKYIRNWKPNSQRTT